MRDQVDFGLSPRVRGNQTEDGESPTLGGSIPACAGEPRRFLGVLGRDAVYPRVCGGTNDIGLPDTGVEGLSPRVRGNPIMMDVTPKSKGSIPACAGEPGSNGGDWG